MVVHALEPVGQPAAAALEEDDAQPRMALEHAAHDEPEAGDLNQIVERFGLAPVANGHALGEGDVAVDQFFPCLRVGVTPGPEF